MRRLTFLFALIICTTMAFGQKSKIQSALNYSKPQYNQLDKAQEAIELAIAHEKTMNNPKAWKVRGQVYQAIATTKDTAFMLLSDSPLDVALKSYKKALELDIKGSLTKEIHNQLMLLGISYVNKGVDYFGTEEFGKGLAAFEGSMSIDSIVDPTKVDSMIIFNAGIAADRAKNYEKAAYYYGKTCEIGYEGSKVYGYLASLHKDNADTAAYVNVLQKGFEKYPGDIAIIFELINHYLVTDKTDDALEYITKGIDKDPSNHTLYFAKGAIYDKKAAMVENTEAKDTLFINAKTAYEKAIEIKSDYFDAYYNLGALYFNKGADMLKEANNVPPNKVKEYNAAVKASFAELAKALPALEKAHEINPTEETTLLTIREIYFKLRSDSDEYMAKYTEYNDKVKALKE